ncbi:MAG: sulfite exporter TauE/SafE family protein [Fusobacteriaceae bacterium]
MAIGIKDTIFLIVVFLTNIIQGITGFAGTVLAMPPGIFLQGIDTSKFILNILGILASLYILAVSYKHVDWKEFFKIVILMLPGLWIGVYLFSILELGFLLKIYSIFIILIAGKGIFIKKEYKLPEIIMLGIIVTSGIIHGMFVSGGPLIMIYIMKKLKDKTTFRATIATIWIVLNTILAINHYTEGLYTPENIKILVLSILPLMFGMYMGNKLHHKMSQESFLKLSYILLLFSGIALLLK